MGKNFIFMSIVSTILMTGCQTTNRPLTFNMTPEQLQKTSAISLCLDSSKYDLPNVEEEIKNRKLNCNKEIYNSSANIALNLPHAELCDGWINGTLKPAVKAFDKEIKKRKINCTEILTIKAQQDSVAAMEAANRQATWNAINQSIQNQQAINAMNRPRYTNCTSFGCTTY